MALNAQEQQMTDNALAALQSGNLDKETADKIIRLARRMEKERKTKETRERMRKNTPALVLSLYPSSADDFDLTEIGQAKHFGETFIEQIRYTEEYGWLFYQQYGEGGRWIKGAQEEVKRLYHRFNDDQVHAALDMLNDTADDKDPAAQQAAKLLAFALKMRTASSTSKILEQAKPYVMQKAEELDADPFKLNTPSGLVDLLTGAVKRSSPNDLCTHMTASEYDRDGTHSAGNAWQDFLKVVTDGDQELQDYLQLIIGRAVLGIVLAQELIILYGKGGNGKSTFMNSIMNVLGDYCVSFEGETLMDTHNNSAQFDRARLHGARLAVFKELKENRTLDTAALKSIASTDRVTAAIKYQMPFDFKPSHSPFLYSNHLPNVNARDNGTWDRLKIVPFNHLFRGQQGEKLNYEETLVSKFGSDILRWIVCGAAWAAGNNFKVEEPKTVTELVKNYRTSTDWLQQFLTCCCEQYPAETGKQIPARTLRITYESYCADEGIKPVSLTRFKRALEEQGFKHGRNASGQYYIGLELKNADDTLE